MDMRGKEPLRKDCSGKILVFGGILGDHPPQDRAKDMRETFTNVRSLGPVQLTTDTALLVAKEIVEDGRALEELAFKDDPEIPSDNYVVPFLDKALAIDELCKNEVGDFEALKKGLLGAVEVFREKMKGGAVELEVDREELTTMEGFRYRVNEGMYPVMRNGKELEGFPIIPIGMLDIWREQEDFPL